MTLHLYRDDFDTPLGTLIAVATADVLTGLYFEGQKHLPSHLPDRTANPPSSPALTALREQIDAYFAGHSRTFNVPVAPPGTIFQRAVWQALLAIPAGATLTYGEVATRLGQPTATRAVAAAIGRNPISIVIPCHRVIGKNGALTGYAGGLPRKAALLALER